MADKTLATGAPLTAETFADFVERLRYHCRGKGVSDHSTACAIFTVEKRVFVYGIDLEYTDKKAIIVDDSCYHSIADYLASLDEEERAELDEAANDNEGRHFDALDEWEQYQLLEDLDDHSVTGRDERWEYVGTHFTKEAAEAFIKRKGHDYPAGLRVYVDAQPYAWEFEAIKEALMDGRLVFQTPAESGKDGAA